MGIQRAAGLRIVTITEVGFDASTTLTSAPGVSTVSSLQLIQRCLLSALVIAEAEPEQP